MHFSAKSPQEMEKSTLQKVNRSPLRSELRFSFCIPIAPFGRYGLVSDVLRWRSGLKG